MIPDIQETMWVCVFPGSLSHARDGRPCSYAILDIDENEIRVEFKFEPEW